ncbi:unnamed protein product, partial [Owenia fusiformis]
RLEILLPVSNKKMYNQMTILLLIQCMGNKLIISYSLAQPNGGSRGWSDLFDELRIIPDGGLSGGGRAKITTLPPAPKTVVPLVPLGPLPDLPIAHDDNQYAVCADIVFANDASCSLHGNVKADQVNLIIDIARSFQISDIAGARFGAFSFGKYVDVQSKMDFIPNADVSTILSRLNNLKTASLSCRTIPYRAMRMSRGYFNGENDRDDGAFKDVLIFIGDGWTSPIRTRKHNIKESKKLRNDNVDILWIKTQPKGKTGLTNERKYGGTVEDIELLPIVGDSTKIFEYKNGERERVIDEITEYLLSHYTCDV